MALVTGWKLVCHWSSWCCPYFSDQSENRFHTLLHFDWANIAQGLSLPFEQPDDKGCQESNSMAVLDPEAND